jgi:hypothetical protein
MMRKPPISIERLMNSALFVDAVMCPASATRPT